jgi:hypothetical protein
VRSALPIPTPTTESKGLQSENHHSGVGYPAVSQRQLRSTRDTSRLSEVETGCTGCLFAWKSLNKIPGRRSTPRILGGLFQGRKRKIPGGDCTGFDPAKGMLPIAKSVGAKHLAQNLRKKSKIFAQMLRPYPPCRRSQKFCIPRTLVIVDA